MKRGPKPKPTQMLRLSGSRRAKERKNEPKPARSTPGCPTWLPKEAKAEWKRIVPILGELGLLAKIDRATLAAYCDSWALFVQATREMQDGDLTVTTDKGNVIQNPIVGIRNKAAKQVHDFAAAFGLSPSARASLKVSTAEEDVDPLEELLNRGRSVA